MTAMVNVYSLFKIPLLAFVTPTFEELNDQRCAVKIRLNMRSRNHLGAMYFGALAMGAELSVAARALSAISESGKRIDFIFKDFQSDFLKRADGHVVFICEETAGVAALVREAANDSERHTKTFSGYAIVPSKSQEPVMNYKVTLSVKQRLQKN